MEREQLQNTGVSRESHSIKRRPAVNVHHATRYAEMIGVPLSTFVTINFTLLGVPPEMAVLLFRTLLAQRFAPWLRRSSLNIYDIRPTYVWAMEGGGGQQAVHWLVHVPPKLIRLFKEKLRSWLAVEASEHIGSKALQIKAVYNLIGVRRYILKGTEPAWAAHLGVQHVPQGIVIGKRSGFSRNLGPTARKSGGYVPRRVPPRSAAA